MRKMICGLIMLMLAISCSTLASGEAVFFYEDTAISSIRGVNGALYSLRDEGLFRYDPGTKEEALVSGAFSSNWQAQNRIDYLLEADQELYGFNATDMTLVKLLDRQGVAVSEPAFQFEALKENEWIEPLLDHGKLIYVKNETGNSLKDRKQKICEVDIATGEETAIEVQGIVLLDLYKNEQYIALTQARSQGVLKSYLAAIDRKTGEQTVLQELEDGLRLAAITYDPVSDRVYALGRSQIYVWQEGEGFVLLTSIIAGDAVDITVISSELVAAVVDNSLVIRNIDPSAAAAQKKLTIQDPLGRGEDYKAYISAHPDVSLVFAGDDSMTNEERFIQDMVTKADGIDVYLLSDKNMLTTIYDKEYGVDLSPSASIKALAEDMYDPFKAAVMRDGKIFVLPKRTFVAVLGYDPSFFETFGFTPPKTYDRLLDLSLTWLEDYSFDHPEVYFQPFNNGIELVALLERYADEMARNGKEIRYNKESLKETIRKYLDVKARYDAESLYQEGGSWDTHAFNVIDIPTGGEYRYLPLAFEEDDQPVISGTDIDFSYFVINPYSQNREEALAFLESCEAGRMDVEKVVLYKSQNAAVKDQTFDEEAAAKQAHIDALAQALASSSPETKKEIEESIRSETESLELFRQNRQFSISQEEIDRYRTFAQYIYIAGLNPFRILTQEYDTMFFQLEEGSMDLDRFMREMDAKIQSLFLEAQ